MPWQIGLGYLWHGNGDDYCMILLYCSSFGIILLAVKRSSGPDANPTRGSLRPGAVRRDTLARAVGQRPINASSRMARVFVPGVRGPSRASISCPAPNLQIACCRGVDPTIYSDTPVFCLSVCACVCVSCSLPVLACALPLFVPSCFVFASVLSPLTPSPPRPSTCACALLLLFVQSIVGASVVNLVLDCVAVFVFGMGIKGAALSTTVAQWAGLLYLVQQVCALPVC